MAYRGGFGFGYGLTPWVKNLLVANFAVFLVTMVEPGVGNAMAFVPQLIFYRPWTLFTYMFVHGNFMHILFNMLALFFFGPPLEAKWGSREFLKFYFLCGLGGAVLSFIFAGSAIIGASAAVYGVMLAFAMNWPDAPIYIWGIFPIPARILVLFMLAMSLFSAFGGRMDGIAHFAHLGGFAAGYIYLKWEAYRGPKGMRKFKKKMTKRHLTVVPGGEEVSAPTQPAARSAGHQNDSHLLDQLDRVLDKINSSGMASLTQAERKLLDEVSRRYRQN